MTKDSNVESADSLRAIAELRGLGRAWTLDPDLVAAAFKRGRQPISSFLKAFSALTGPANRFEAEPGK